MKTKLLSVILLRSVLLTFTGCGNSTDKNQDPPVNTEISTENTENTESVEVVTPIYIGTVSDTEYKNEYFNIGWKSTEGWSYLDKTNILLLNGIYDEITDEEFNEIISENVVFCDMQALNTDNGDSVSVQGERKGSSDLYSDASSYATAAIPQIKDALENMGAINIVCEASTTTFLDMECPCINVSCQISEITFLEKLVCFDTEKYVVVITVGSFDESNIDNILNSFYKIK